MGSPMDDVSFEQISNFKAGAKLTETSSLHSTPLHSTPLHSTPLHSTLLYSTLLYSTLRHTRDRLGAATNAASSSGKSSKQGPRSLAQVLSDASKQQRADILNNLGRYLGKIVDKGLLFGPTYTHYLLLQYLRVAPHDVIREMVGTRARFAFGSSPFSTHPPYPPPPDPIPHQAVPPPLWLQGGLRGGCDRRWPCPRKAPQGHRQGLQGAGSTARDQPVGLPPRAQAH